jgi:two-component system LytT family response regulator
MKNQIIQTIVVDDEPAARQGMILMLRDEPEIEVIASCRNGIEAIQEIREKKPDLLLLDIQMPGIDGFDVLNNIPTSERPFIVFVTAYDQFAVRAFEYHALDYILKPYTNERFFEMIKRVKNLINQQKQVNQMEKIDQLSKKLLQERKNLSEIFILSQENEIDLKRNKLIVREGGKIHFIPLGDIRYFEAYDYYVKIHTEEGLILVRMPLKNLERQLPATIFARIHRSYILNLLFLKRIDRNDAGEYQVILTDDCLLKVSDTYRKDLLKRINIP